MSSILGPCLLALESDCYSGNAYHCPGKVLSTPNKLPKDGASFSPAVGRLGGRGEWGGHLCVSTLRAPRSADPTARRVLSAGTRSGPPGARRAGQSFRLGVDGGCALRGVHKAPLSIRQLIFYLLVWPSQGISSFLVGSHPRPLSEDAAITQWETNGAISSPFSSALLSSLGRVSSLLGFSVIDSAGITWHVADPFHRGTDLLAQLLSLAYFVSQTISHWKHS